jgi:uncharacterized protein (DUF983 family)
VALARGLRKRCPHCGRGPLFERWGRHLDRCSSCGLIYERNPGDTWFFTIIGDRIPVALAVLAIYFGVARSHRWWGVAAFVVMVALLVWTAPNRWGVGIALHYVSRVKSADPDDPVPPPEPGLSK